MTKKILCTLGPASLNARTIRRLHELNVDLFRLNLSHTKLEQIEETVNLIRTHSDIPICFDSQGAQVRTGILKEGSVTLALGSIVKLINSASLGDSENVPLYPTSVISKLFIGDMVSIDFGTTLLQITEVQPVCSGRVVSSGTIGSNKAVSIDRRIDLPPLTDVDIEAVEKGLKLGIKNFALSFANCQKDVSVLRDLIGDEGNIIAKIESIRGLKNLTEIMSSVEAILIDRGDLSREVMIESLPFVQKEIIKCANKANVPVYVATNLLESMVVSPKPTRAEVNDVVNTLLDGADGLVLAAETAIGEHPVGCARMIRTLIEQCERKTKPVTLDGHFSTTSQLISPHGGKLVEQINFDYDLQSLQELPKLNIDEYIFMDVQQIAVGAFSPLQGFMGQDELHGVLKNNCLPDGTIWTMPILLQVFDDSIKLHQTGKTLALVNDGKIRALLYVDECYEMDLKELAIAWFGTDDTKHPGVSRLFSGSKFFIAGKVDLLSENFAYRQRYEITPAQTRLIFEHRHWQKIVGFHTRNVAHRAHEYLQNTALSEQHCDGLLIHPVIGPKKIGDFSAEIILKSYEHIIENYYPSNNAMLAGFVSYSRYAGPREAIFTAICRKNFGCSHIIVGRDHTGVGDFYSLDASKKLFETVGDIGIQPIFYDEVYYCDKCKLHVERCVHDQKFSQNISSTQAREMISRGEILPEWYMRESVSNIIFIELERGNKVFVE